MALCTCGKPKSDRALWCAPCRDAKWKAKKAGPRLYRKVCPECKRVRLMRLAGIYCGRSCASKARHKRLPQMMRNAALEGKAVRRQRWMAELDVLTKAEIARKFFQRGYMSCEKKWARRSGRVAA